MSELLSDKRFQYFAIAAVVAYVGCGIAILNKIYGKGIDKRAHDPYAAFLLKKELYAFSLLFWPLLWLNHALHFEEKPKDDQRED